MIFLVKKIKHIYQSFSTLLTAGKFSVFYIIGLALIIGVVLALYLQPPTYNPNKKDYVIEFTESGYQPHNLMVPFGSTVTFTNKTEHYNWPASDPHPAHNIFSAFDPRGPLKPGESWSFTFNQSGVWAFHDHMQANFDGKIIVNNEDGSLVDTNCEANQNVEACWNDKLIETLHADGINGTLKLLRNIYETEPTFNLFCHRFMHNIGLKAYLLHGTDFDISEEIGYCNGGFLHGYIEGLVRSTTKLSEVTAFCDKLGQVLESTYPNGVSQCRHGIGHGLMEHYINIYTYLWNDPPALYAKVIEQCDKIILDDIDKFRCASGAIGVWIEWIESDKNYKEQYFDTDYILSICHQQTVYFAKAGCYWDAAKRLPPQFEEIIVPDDVFSALIDHFPPEDYEEYLGGAVRSMGFFVGKKNPDGTFEALIDICKRNMPDQNLVDICILSTMESMVINGLPGNEHIKGLQYCNDEHLDEKYKETCFRQLQDTITIIRPGLAPQICAQIDSKYHQPNFCN